MYDRYFLGAFFLVLTFFVGGSVQAATTTRTILRMADGRLYDPVSGRSGVTQAELFPEEIQEHVSTTTVVTGGTSATSTNETTTTTSAIPESPLSLAVARGKALLVGEPLTTATKATVDTDWRTVDLVVWTPETDEVVRVRTSKKGSAIKFINVTDFSIDVRTSNGLESTYNIKSLTNASTTPRVVAVRYPLYHPITIGKKTTYAIEEVIYSPYATSLHTPEIIARGKAYLDQQLNEIYQDLDQKKIKSVMSPDKLVTQVVRPEVAKAILVIEHTDTKSLEQQPELTLERFYVTLGLNESLAYAYEESQVGALGAPQFMESTYKLITRQTALGLDPNFARGMRDLKNSMTAQVVYLDRLLAAMPDAIQAQHDEHPFDAGAYVVAAYNGGEGRIIRAVKNLGEDWDTSQAGELASLNKQAASAKAEVAALKKKLSSKAVEDSATQTKTVKKNLATAQTRYVVLVSQIDELRKSMLRPETVGYLKKYHLALPFLVDLNIATSTASTVQAVPETPTTTVL